MTEPKMTTTWGAGFSFSKCHAERRVPYDPYLDQVHLLEALNAGHVLSCLPRVHRFT